MSDSYNNDATSSSSEHERAASKNHAADSMNGDTSSTTSLRMPKVIVFDLGGFNASRLQCRRLHEMCWSVPECEVWYFRRLAWQHIIRRSMWHPASQLRWQISNVIYFDTSHGASSRTWPKWKPTDSWLLIVVPATLKTILCGHYGWVVRTQCIKSRL